MRVLMRSKLGALSLFLLPHGRSADGRRWAAGQVYTSTARGRLLRLGVSLCALKLCGTGHIRQPSRPPAHPQGGSAPVRGAPGRHCQNVTLLSHGTFVDQTRRAATHAIRDAIRDAKTTVWYGPGSAAQVAQRGGDTPRHPFRAGLASAPCDVMSDRGAWRTNSQAAAVGPRKALSSLHRLPLPPSPTPTPAAPACTHRKHPQRAAHTLQHTPHHTPHSKTKMPHPRLEVAPARAAAAVRGGGDCGARGCTHAQ